MAKKSIIIAETKLVEHIPTYKMQGNEAYPEDIEFSTKYALKKEILDWCWANIGYCKFNTRKGRIKFNNESDATLFKLTWM